MDKSLYRVVLTGELVPGFSREAVIAALSRLFQVSAASLIPVFQGTEHPVEEALSAEDAAALQGELEALGARARIDRISIDAAASSHPPVSLHLPRLQDSADAGLMHCPACGHQQLVAASCDECGVVFADYNREHAARAAAVKPEVARPTASTGQAAPESRRPYITRPNDIHADAEAGAGWREGWLGEDEVPTEEYHVNLFMGMRSRRLSDACNKLTLGRRTRFKLTWTGGAVFSPFLWAMYRKMWAWALVIFVTEILLPVLMISLGVKDNISDKLIALAVLVMLANRVFWPAIMKSLYCRHARQTIRYMHRMAPTYAADIDIATRGGTSRTSVFVGTVLALVVSLLTWSVVGTLHGAFMARTPVYIPPPTLPQTGTPQAPDTATNPQDDLLANENKWVATRNRLRVLGQRLNTWFADRGRSLDPASLDIPQIARALSLDSDSTTDGWGREIAFESDGRGYRLSSAGPDGKFGSSDDVEYRRILER